MFLTHCFTWISHRFTPTFITHTHTHPHTQLGYHINVSNLISNFVNFSLKELMHKTAPKNAVIVTLG
jgi:hypothetical protein